MPHSRHPTNSSTKAALERQFEERRQIYAAAIANLKAFGEALRNLPYPPWDLPPPRQRDHQRRKQQVAA
jgi:hypothetical protein